MIQKNRLDMMRESEKNVQTKNYLDRNRHSQVFYNSNFFDDIYPMDIKYDAGIELV